MSKTSVILALCCFSAAALSSDPCPDLDSHDRRGLYVRGESGFCFYLLPETPGDAAGPLLGRYDAFCAGRGGGRLVPLPADAGVVSAAARALVNAGFARPADVPQFWAAGHAAAAEGDGRLCHMAAASADGGTFDSGMDDCHKRKIAACYALARN